MWFGARTITFLLLQTSLPFSLSPYLKTEGAHLLHSRCPEKEGSLPLPPPSSPACREAGVRDRENGSYPVSVSSPFCPLLPSLRHRHKLGGGGASHICVCAVGVGWGVPPLERKMIHWAMGQAPWEKPGQPQARAPGS